MQLHAYATFFCEISGCFDQEIILLHAAFAYMVRMRTIKLPKHVVVMNTAEARERERLTERTKTVDHLIEVLHAPLSV